MTMKLSGDNLIFPDNSVQWSAAYLAWRNRIMNGDMRINQYGSSASFPVDRFMVSTNVSGKITAQQNQQGASPFSGFPNYLGFSVAAAYTPAAGDWFQFQQRIEGVNVADLDWGTANAKPVALSFKVRSSVTGTFSGALKNSGAARSYPFTYSITQANTPTDVVVVIPGDQVGTWLKDTGIGIDVVWSLGMGSTFEGVAGAWAGANYGGATGAVKLVTTAGATFQITGVQLEPLLSTVNSATPFERVDYSEMRRRCQRYYERKVAGTTFSAFAMGSATSTTTAECKLFYDKKRTAPAITVGNSTNFGLIGGGGGQLPVIAAITAGIQDVESCALTCTVASGLSGGQATALHANGSTAPYIEISAEL